MNIIETAYVARSEPARLKLDLAKDVGEVLNDEEDQIDFTLCGNGRSVLFERKRAQDLINSFLEANEASGEPRVLAQIRRLVDSQGSDVLLCLLVEEHIYNRGGYAYAEGVRRKVAFNAIDNFLVLVQRWGIMVVRSGGLAHTAARMVSVAEGWMQTGDKSPLIMLPQAPAPQLRTLMTFPRIGIKGAKKVAATWRVDGEEHTTLRELLHNMVHDNDIGLGSGVQNAVKKYLDTPISFTGRK